MIPPLIPLSGSDSQYLNQWIIKWKPLGCRVGLHYRWRMDITEKLIGRVETFILSLMGGGSKECDGIDKPEMRA